MLVVWLRFPIIIEEGTQDVLYPIDCLGLSTIRDELFHSSSFSYVILQGDDKLLVSFHSIDICNKSFGAYKILCASIAIVHSWDVMPHSVCSDWFRLYFEIKCRKRRVTILL